MGDVINTIIEKLYFLKVEIRALVKRNKWSGEEEERGCVIHLSQRNND